MKTPLLLYALLFIAACGNPAETTQSHQTKKQKAPSILPDSTQTKIKSQETNTLVSPDDTTKIYVAAWATDSAVFTKGELRKVLKYHPELSGDDFPYPPDVSYALRNEKSTDIPTEDDVWLHFGSEQGQDAYYGFYAYVLSRKNGLDKYAGKRKQLIKIFRDVNYIMGRLVEGGTYYGHQYYRIVGYAEYAIYLSDGNDEYYSKPYNITEQKNLYISGLKQYIADEIANNLDIHPSEKPVLKKDLWKTVSEIDSLLTNYFYLKAAREFQHSSY